MSTTTTRQRHVPRNITILKRMTDEELNQVKDSIYNVLSLAGGFDKTLDSITIGNHQLIGTSGCRFPLVPSISNNTVNIVPESLVLLEKTLGKGYKAEYALVESRINSASVYIYYDSIEHGEELVRLKYEMKKNMLLYFCLLVIAILAIGNQANSLYVKTVVYNDTFKFVTTFYNFLVNKIRS